MASELDADLACQQLTQCGTRKARIAQLLTEPEQQPADGRVADVETRLQSCPGPPKPITKPILHGLGGKAADNRNLLPATALRVYELTGWKEEHLPEGLELLDSPAIGKTTPCRRRSRQHGKLEAMLRGSVDHIDGLTPHTTNNLCMAEPKRGLRLDSRRDVSKLAHHPDRSCRSRRQRASLSENRGCSRGNRMSRHDT